MRKMRIDELAQLFNVLKGDMHLVGPRAEWDILVNEYENIIENYNLRHSVRPGITGLAQIRYPYGRGVEDARKKLKYDISYIKHWSLKMEIRILIDTISIVLKQGGV
jgi:lipopolysaccharide/colanic/teichoic acid biosynthesis glycosyltransferase